MGSLYVIVLVLLFLTGIPVAFALGGTSVVMTIIERGFNFNSGFMVQKAVYGLDNFLLLAVPFFLYAGKVMNVGGITERIFRFAKSLVWKPLRGGLGHVNVVSSIIFAGMTGTAVSDAAGLGAVELKAMDEAGYDPDFAVAITAASSTIGPIIPPSVPLVIYGLMTGVSIGGILIAGLIPGIIMGIAMMVAVEIYAIKNKMPVGDAFNIREIWSSFKQSFFPLLTPFIIIGGMLSGIFTPTEAAAIAALYATILAVVIYKEITWKDLWGIMKSTVIDTGAIMMIVSLAMVYGYLITRSNITLIMVEKIASISTDPVIVSLILIVFLLFVGCFLEATAAITILAPVLQGVLERSSIDPLQFGIVMVLTMMIGLLTPPFGMVLFVLNRISGIPLQRIVKAVLPFLIPLLFVDVLLVIFPKIVTFLPNLIFK
jgi:tripartite ATP-independent transporter DctM subunit